MGVDNVGHPGSRPFSIMLLPIDCRRRQIRVSLHIYTVAFELCAYLSRKDQRFVADEPVEVQDSGKFNDQICVSWHIYSGL